MKRVLFNVVLISIICLNNVIAQNKVLDTDAEVGSLSGSLIVNQLGAATYSIPLEIPVGIANMTPKLSVSYNSLMGNSILGNGWSINGLSSITKTGQTLYHDDNVRGVEFNGLDNLLLDGQRLIGAFGIYHTEIENYSKIIAHDYEMFEDPSWFEVYGKNGLIYEYGNSISSKVYAPGKDDILTWHVNKIKDRNGNSIEFEYHNLNGLGDY